MIKLIHQVEEIIDGDTFDVSPKWRYGDRMGERVRIADINAPEKGEVGAEAATKKLKSIIGNILVDLDPQAVDQYGRLVAHVFLHGKNIAPSLRTR